MEEEYEGSNGEVEPLMESKRRQRYGVSSTHYV